MKKTVIIISFSLLFLSACQPSASEAQLTFCQYQLIDKDLKIEELTLEKNNLFGLIDSNKIEVIHTYKGELNLKLQVLAKIEGPTSHPYLIIAQDLDVDHNTPLVFNVESELLFNQITINQLYDFNVYVISVVEEFTNHTRFEFMILGIN